jgi:hypothetical protein
VRLLLPHLDLELGCSNQPPTFTIPSHSYNRRPADIPLHTFSSSARQPSSDAAHLLNDDDDQESTRSSFDTPESDSDLSLWSDTGDLVDQLADREDPLRIRLRGSLEGGSSSRPRRQQKRVRYEPTTRFNEKERGLRLEDIEIPDPGPQTISKAERILASIMAPNDGPSRIHGLHGKKLM